MRRLSVSLLIVVLVSTIGLGWAFDRLFYGLVKTETDGLQVYREVGNDLVTSVESHTQLVTIIAAWPESNPIKLRLIGAAELALPVELKDQIGSGEPLVLESESDVLLLFAVPDSEQLLSLSPPQVESETPLAVVLTMLFYSGVISLVLLWIYPLASRLLALGRGAKAFGEGQLDRRVSTHQRSLLYEIENEFNAMAQRIQSLIADNKMLASAVSHDLRTPLARLRFGIDLLDEAKDEQVRAEYQLRLSNDLTAMENLVDVLLEYARLDKQLSDMHKSPINLSKLINDSVESLSDLSDTAIEWDQSTEQFITHAHARYVAMMINNLLQNAVNYTNGRVSVSLAKKRAGIVLSIEDDGPGIPAEMRNEMLKPFVRGKREEANVSSKGFGMGLAIVSRIAQWHDAQFVIGRSEKLGGAQFVILFAATSSTAAKDIKLNDKARSSAMVIDNK